MQAIIDLWLRRWRRRRAIAPAFAGKRPVTVVTGASQGLGLQLAIRFAALGNPVMLVARDAERLAVAARTVEKACGMAPITVAADLSVAAGVDAIDAALSSHNAYCNVLVNNAAMGLSGPFERHDPDDILRLLDLNMRALTDLMHRHLPGMLQRGSGGIVNVASLGAYLPGPHQAAYYASKAYVLSLTEAVGYECRGQGVRICALAPGPFSTRFHANMGAQSAYYAALARLTGADAIARSAFRGYLWGQRVIVPGIVCRAVSVVVRVVPHPVLVPIVGCLLRRRGASDA